MTGNIRIDSVINLLKEINKIKFFDCFFRGHSNSEWDLIPTIGRNRSQIIYYQKWEYLEEDLLEKFKKFSIPYLTIEPKYKYEWSVIAQHHGVPTRILDWTTNPLKALYFAIEDPKYFDKNAALWAFKPKGYYYSLKKLHEMEKGKINLFIAYYPDNLNPRIIAQDSCFTFFPLPDSTEANIVPLNNKNAYKDNIECLIKFEIKKENKSVIYEELKRLGISHRSLFPDLDGLSVSIRREYRFKW